MIKKLLVFSTLFVFLFTVLPVTSFSSEENWYETEITVLIPPGESVEVSFENGIFNTDNNIQGFDQLMTKIPEWLRTDLYLNLKSLSKSAERLPEGAYVQAFTLLPEDMEAMIISGFDDHPIIIDLNTTDKLDILPKNIDKNAKLSFADLNYDNFSDLIVCPESGGWYWLSGPSFAISNEGDGIKSEWGRKQLYPLTNPKLSDTYEISPMVSGISFLNDDDEIKAIDKSEFIYDYPNCFASLSSKGLLFVDAESDIRYFRVIDDKPQIFKSDSMTIVPNFDGESHLTFHDDKLYVGTFDSGIQILEKNEHGSFINVYEKLDLEFGNKVCPQMIDFSLDNVADLVWSDLDGVFVAYGPNWNKKEKLNLWTETTIAVGDITADNIPEFITIQNGGVSVFEGSSFEEMAIEIPELEGKLFYPAIGDANGDEKNDIILGSDEGTLQVFLAPDWHKADILSTIDVGDFSYPSFTDFDGDGRDDLVITNVFGETFTYKATPDGWQEYNSWSFTPGYPYYEIQDYYKRYYRDAPLFKWNDDIESVKKYVDLLMSCPKQIIDETAFCVAHTSSEILRTMARMGQADIFKRNAQMVYKADTELDYVELIDELDYTKCVYHTNKGEVVLPKEDYYWYVVHPRTLYELPVAVDASWWEISYEEREMSQEDWWKHSIDPETFYEGEKREFWREGLFEDNSFGNTVIDATKNQVTLDDAIFSLHSLLKHGKETHNIFGYLTGDLYPWHIYKKHYGSCGEQSQLFASCARTVLIPNYIVVNAGEDHQWNEVWLPQGWTHFDLNFGDNPIDNPRVYETGWKKTVSTVWGWRGDDYFFPTTATVHGGDYEEQDFILDAGYTDVSNVTFNVFDVNGNPVEGAMLLVRSGWNARNSLSYWDYTNADGVCMIDLGYEPYYIIDCVSPYGSTGLSRFVVKEGEDCSVNLYVPGAAPKKAKTLNEMDDGDGYKIEVSQTKEYLRPPNRISSFGYRLGSFLAENYGYRGVEDYKHIVAETQTMLSVGSSEYGITSDSDFYLGKSDKFVLTNRSNLSWKEITLKARVEFPEFSFDFGLPEEIIKVKSGESFKLDMNPKSTSPIVYLMWGWDEGNMFDFGEDYILKTGMGGPPKPGIKKLYLKAGVVFNDFVREVTDSVDIEILPTNKFLDQPVFQDQPDPLKGVSWTFGPFTVADELDYFLIKTSSKTASLDLDIFLYQDKNNDGKIDKDERIGASTSPSSDERILLKIPEKGPYYLLCQGCTVTEENSTFDVEFSSIPSW